MSDTGADTVIDIRVVPNASRSEVVGWLGEVLKVKVQAPPEGGRANQQVIATLAKAFGIPRRAITIEHGATARNKRVRVAGLAESRLHSVFPTNK